MEGAAARRRLGHGSAWSTAGGDRHYGFTRILASLATLWTVTACAGERMTGPPPALPPAKLGVERQPAEARSGASFGAQPIVRVEDQTGELVSADESTVVTVAISSGTGVLSGTRTAETRAGRAVFSNLTITGTAGEYTLLFTASGLSPVTSVPFTLEPGAASPQTSTLSVSSGIVILGESATITLHARDAQGNAHTSGGLTVAFTASGGTSEGSISPTTDHDDGTYSATFTATAPGTPTTVQATINGRPLASPSPTLAVERPKPLRLEIERQPGEATSGVALGSQPILRLVDADGDLVAEDDTTRVTAVLASGGGSLEGSVAASASGGRVVFTDLTITGVVGPRTLAFTAASANGTTSAPFVLAPGPASPGESEITASASMIRVGESTELGLRARDAQGNAHTAGGLSVLFSFSGGTSEGTIGATVDHGDGTYSATFTGDVAGTPTSIEASIDGVSVTSPKPTVRVDPVPQRLVIQQQPAEAASGAPLGVQPIVRIEDENGDVITTDDVTIVTAALASGGGTLGGTLSIQVAAGFATFTDLTVTGIVGPRTLSFSAASVGPVTSAQFTLEPGVASPETSIVSVASPSIVVGEGTQITLQVRDAEGNAHTSGGLAVAFSNTGGSSEGIIGSTVTDHDDGTYTAFFTGTSPGTATTIGASIDGEDVTSILPTVEVMDAGLAVCEAQGDARCWYVSPVGSDTNSGTFGAPFQRPQVAVDLAGPGDFIYLRGGGYGLELATRWDDRTGSFIIRSMPREGAPGAPITLKSYPGEQPVIEGSPNVMNNNVAINRSYWRVEGLTVRYGMIIVAWFFTPNVHDVWIADNDICCAVSPLGNTGLIWIHADPLNAAPYNIFVHGNSVHDLYGCESTATSPCTGPRLPWDQDFDTEHHACFTIMRGTGLIEFRQNVAYNCAATFYFKYEWDGPTLVEDNDLHDAQQLGLWRNSNNTLRHNVVYDVGLGIWTRGQSIGNTYEQNTWVGLDRPIRIDAPSGHSIRSNVIFGDTYLRADDLAGTDADENCFITPSSFQALLPAGLTLDELRTQHGLDLSSTRIVETNVNAVFTNPAVGDFGLIGEAATECPDAGAR